MRRWFALVLIGLAFLSAGLAVGRLPSDVTLDFSRLVPFPVPASEPGSSLMLFVAPAAAAAVWALLQWGKSGSAARVARALWGSRVPEDTLNANAIRRFEPTYDVIANFVVALLVVFHFLLLALVLNPGTGFLRAIVSAIGLLLMLAGNLMPRLRPNPVMGVRTASTMRDPNLWVRTHRVLGMMFVVAGLGTITAALVALQFALAVAVVGIVCACVVSAIYLAAQGRGRVRTSVVLALGLHAAAATALHAQLVNVPAVPPSNVREEPLSFTSGGITLSGTLATPAANHARIPFAIIVVGSGPTDRNGNGPLVRTNMYAQLAWQLAQQGIGSLRYDKRGLGPSGLKIDHMKLVTDDFVNDVAAAAAAVRARSDVGKLLLIGHSEGAQLVLQASNRGLRADGLVMISGMGRSLRDVLHDQFSLQLDSAGVAKFDVAFQRFLNGEDPDDVPDAARVVFVPIYRTYLKSMAAYDPAQEMRKATVPVLLVQGEMDLQVTGKDAERLRSANPKADVLLLPKTNHVLKRTESMDPKVQKPIYADPTLPIVEELVPAIVKWFRRR
jgi:pimeloyl-ACP methyl ester carboxylesterase